MASEMRDTLLKSWSATLNESFTPTTTFLPRETDGNGKSGSPTDNGGVIFKMSCFHHSMNYGEETFSNVVAVTLKIIHFFRIKVILKKDFFSYDFFLDRKNSSKFASLLSDDGTQSIVPTH